MGARAPLLACVLVLAGCDEIAGIEVHQLAEAASPDGGTESGSSSGGDGGSSAGPDAGTGGDADSE